MSHPPLPNYRYEWRFIERLGRTESVAVRRVRGSLPDDTEEFRMLSDSGTLYDIESLRRMPGQRQFTVAEYLGARRRNERRYGTWVLVLREHTEADAAFGDWCRHHCADETAAGFRIRPEAWAANCNDTLPIIFLPEFDDPRPSVRDLAASERHRRVSAARVEAETDSRDLALAAASERGLTRRQAAELLELSVGRVQQLLDRAGR